MKLIATLGRSNGTISQEVPLSVIAEEIRTGAYRDDIDRIRSITNKKLRARVKYAQLPAFRAGSHYKTVIPPGRKTNVLKENFICNSGASMLDFDDLRNLDEVYAAYLALPSCVMLFRSPSGTGLKAIVAHQKTESYREYRLLKRFLIIPFKELADPACFCNASLSCFMSYDENVYYNPDPVPMNVEIPDVEKKKQKRARAKVSYEPASIAPGLEKEILTAIQPFLKVTSYTEYFIVGTAMATLNAEQNWLDILENTDWDKYTSNPGREYDEDEAKEDYATYRDYVAVQAKAGEDFCDLRSLVHLAKKNGFSDPEILMLCGGLL